LRRHRLAAIPDIANKHGEYFALDYTNLAAGSLWTDHVRTPIGGAPVGGGTVSPRRSVARTTTSRPAAGMAHGVLYIGNFAGLIYAFDLSGAAGTKR
jgi:hypothetical protein